MDPNFLKNNIAKTLLYYDIFSHPLKDCELFAFLPQNSMSETEFENALHKLASDDASIFAGKNGYYYIKPKEGSIDIRRQRENYSKKMWKRAALVTHIIKRFPYVRCVTVTGSLSKNSSDESSDLDFMIITAKNRLWIARTSLMLFKKIFLFNSYKYFCVNYFITEDSLEIEEKNIFTATEIAHIKATFNSDLMNEFINSNSWIKEFFPNYILCDPRLHSPGYGINNNKSIAQGIFEFFLNGSTGSRLNEYFKKVTVNHWKKRYSQLKEEERNHMFKSTDSVSKTHPLNMQKKILNMYHDKLKQFNIDTD